MESKIIKICDPTYDLTFKRIFKDNTENGKKRTISLLSSLLNLDIKSLEFEDTFYDEQFKKLAIYDILCSCRVTCKNGVIIDIEMQKKRTKDYFDRTAYYGMTQVTKYGIKGEANYQKMPRIIVLTFLDDTYEIFKDKPVFSGGILYRPFNIQEEMEIPPIPLTNILRLDYFQLPVIGKMLNEGLEIENFNKTAMEWLRILSSKYISKGAGSEIEVDITGMGIEPKEAVDILSTYRTGKLYDQFRDSMISEQIVIGTFKSEKESGEMIGKTNQRMEIIIKYYYSKFKEDYKKNNGKVSIKIGKDIINVNIETVRNALIGSESDKEYNLFLVFIEEILKRNSLNDFEELPFFLSENKKD